MKPKIKFDTNCTGFILEALGKTTNAEGYVIDIETTELELNLDNKPFKPEDIRAIHKHGWITSLQQEYSLIGPRWVE